MKISIDDAIKELSIQWQASGIEKGDTILIHSNIKRTLIKMRRKGIKLLPEHIFQSMLNAVGSKGTLLLPLFNFDFPTSKFFDISNTPSQMGALTEIARLHSGSVRTGHPIYSFAVIGYHSKAFAKIDNISGYGADSPFSLLRSLNGKIAILDLEDQNSMTFYHYVEEMLNVSYRYLKEFDGIYIDRNGLKTNRNYKLFVRDLESNVLTHVNPAGELMWDAGLYKGDRPLINNGLRTINAQDMYEFVTKIIESGNAENTLFKYGKQ